MVSNPLISDAVKTSDLFYRAHICGIGGIGTSGLALLLSDLGFHPTGSDLRQSEITQLLQQRHIEIRFDQDTSILHDASCVIRPAVFPASHPALLYAKQHDIPILDRTHALALICRNFAQHTTICFGTLTRAAGARMIAQAIPQSGWCTGAALRDGSAHAKFGNHLVIDLDERDFMADPSLYDDFANADAVITDWQHPDFGYYPQNCDAELFASELGSRQMPRIVYPFSIDCNICITRTIQHFYIENGFERRMQMHSFERTADNRIIAPKGWQFPDIRISDAPGMLSMQCTVYAYLHLLRCCDIPRPQSCIGWFENIDNSGLRVHDIRMHPVNIAAALQALKHRAPNHRIVLVIKPFVSTLKTYDISIWREALADADAIYVTTPPYPGANDTDCMQFAESLTASGKSAHCMPIQSVADALDPQDAVLYSGAPDIIAPHRDA